MTTDPRPLVVICAVGLTPAHIGAHTPCLRALGEDGFIAPMRPDLPAVTTTAQTSMITGVHPDRHGIVANGWYFRELGEVWLWRQSQRLLEAPCVWSQLRVGDRPLRVLKHFWWYAMNTDVAATVTPRPVYHADGAKSPDFYAWPPELKERIAAAHGPFPLFHFWGPTAGLRSSRWIAESFCTAWDASRPDLALCYLPHLDYDLQRHGPTGPHLSGNLAAIDACCRTVIDHARERGAAVLVVSEYGIEAAHTAIPINRVLREAGLLAVTTNAAGELLDPGMSRAFAVADHQIAHVYCADASARDAALQVLADLPGIDRCYSGEQRAQIHLDHPRAGQIVALADHGAWFAYEYWLDDARRPDFANCVEIHKKPGYDPRELLFDPRGGKLRAARALLRKKLGLRYRMNPVSLDPALVRGTHGRSPAAPEHGPVVIGSDPAWQREDWQHIDVAGTIAAHCG